jgi:NADPH:quinone reductase
MLAWRAHEFGPPSTLRWEELPDPPLAGGQIRVRMGASAVNFPDMLLVAGQYQLKPPLPFTPGMEVAGVIEESRAPGLPVGARVLVLSELGGYATHLVAGAANAWLLPDGIPDDEAAALTVTYQTGWFGLHRRAGLRAGETMLVHAGAGGVGSAAIQLGKSAGAKVIATAGGADKVAVCKQLGADLAIDYKTDDFVAAVKDATRGRGADVVYDPVGGEVFEKSTKCIAFEGRIVLVGFTSGIFPTVRANHVLLKNYSVVGLHWGLYRAHDPGSLHEAQHELFRLHSEGRIKPLVGERAKLADAPAALSRVATRGSVGKVVLVP